MKLLSFKYLHSVLFATAGFALWVVADSLMKLAGETALPPHEVVGFLGLFAAGAVAAIYIPQGKIRVLMPQHSPVLIMRGLLAFGTVMSNAVALRYLPLTLFYIVIFLSPMIVAMLASVFLQEKLNWSKLAAIAVGFVGVVIAIEPWQVSGDTHWIGYVAAAAAALFYAAATILTRVKTQSETAASMVFTTGVVEAVLGFGWMLWHYVPVSAWTLLILFAMGLANVSGNIFNCLALRLTTAATVEQFHYTQLVFGAVIGYVVWHEWPSQPMIFGAIIIVLSGLYVVAAEHRASQLAMATKE